MASRLNSRMYGAVLIAACLAHIGAASASVVMTGTRVIYAGDSPEQTLQFSNQDEGPSVMQIWVDAGDAQSTPETADAPFHVSPSVFRIAPKTGQAVRLIFTGRDLPQDRETVFYLNTLQIPALSSEYARENRMLVILRNRLKLFYRPSRIDGDAGKALDRISFRLDRQGKATRVVAKNASGYYMTILDGSVTCGASPATFLPSDDMVAPHSEASWDLKGQCAPSDKTPRVKIRYVNDYSAVREAEYPAAMAEAGSK